MIRATATTACAFSTSQLPKVLRAWCGFRILTLKRSSRHNGVHFLNLSTSKSKSGTNMRWPAHFDFKMCCAPQRLAIFHLSSGQMALHPPLERVYFSTLWNHQIWEKHKGFATFLPFRAPASSFFRLFLFYDLSSSLLFSDSYHLYFSICPYCRNFDF